MSTSRMKLAAGVVVGVLVGVLIGLVLYEVRKASLGPYGSDASGGRLASPVTPESSTNCVGENDGTPCNDGYPQTTNDHCLNGWCRGDLTPAPALKPWPVSDKQLDFVRPYYVSFSKASYEATRNYGNLPVFAAYAVDTNWVTPSILDATGPWVGGTIQLHNQYTPATQVSVEPLFIHTFDPDFFAQANVNATQHYSRFMAKYRAENSNTLYGGYISILNCIDGHDAARAWGTTIPLENTDCWEISQGGQGALGENGLYTGGAAIVESVYTYMVDIKNPVLAELEQYRIAVGVAQFSPLPDFVYLDNYGYFEPGVTNGSGTIDWYNFNDPFVNCGSTSTEGFQWYKDHREFWNLNGLSPTDGITQTMWFNHGSALLRRLNQLNMRGLPNMAHFAWTEQTCWETRHPTNGTPYPTQLRNALVQTGLGDGGQVVANGIDNEQPFAMPEVMSPLRAYHEMVQYRSWLSYPPDQPAGNKIAIFFNRLGIQGRWTAAMSLLLREQGQSVFVQRNSTSAIDSIAEYYTTANNPIPWPYWPGHYGLPSGDVSWQSKCHVSTARLPDYWESYYTRRQFASGDLYAVHGVADRSRKDYGCANNGSVNLKTLLSGSLSGATFSALASSALTGGAAYDAASGCYTPAFVPDGGDLSEREYFTLASPACSKLSCPIDVEIAIGILSTNLRPDPLDVSPWTGCYTISP